MAARRARKELLELDALTAARNFHAVVDLGLRLLDRRFTQRELTLIRFHLGQAYCRLVQPLEALRYLPPARAAFERHGEEWLAVDALDWEASAWGLLEDPRSFALENQALERCRQLQPPPRQLEARILGHLANMFVVARSWAQAIAYYEAAAEAASAVKDLLQVAKMHHGLALAHQRLRQPTSARDHYDKALALYSIESDLSAVYRLENDIGDLLLQEGQLDAAEAHFLKALAGADQLHIDRRGRGFILANLGDVCLRKGRVDEARCYLAQAMKAGEAQGERIVLADAEMLLGRLEGGLGNHESADRHFLKAIHWLDVVAMPMRRRDCHIEYAQVLEERGDVRAAYRQLQLAAVIESAAVAG